MSGNNKNHIIEVLIAIKEKIVLFNKTILVTIHFYIVIKLLISLRVKLLLFLKK